MRRIISVLLAFIILCGLVIAHAESSVSAYELATILAEAVPEMTNIRDMPLNEKTNRAIWTDSRIDKKCALVVFDDAEGAVVASVADATRNTAVRIIDNYALYISNDLEIEKVQEYHQALAEILGEELNLENPDYILCLNVSTKKFHKPGCSSIDEMKESNKQHYNGESDLLIEHGYEACQRCRPLDTDDKTEE